ncbi:MAG: hypothetical protein Pars2KO_31300 [Parasphingorhabdus sp.]
MIKRFSKYLVLVGIIFIVLILLAWVTSPDPKLNMASFEDKPVTERIAPLDEAVTLAQYRDENGKIVTFQVLSFSEKTVTGIDLSELGASNIEDPFAALSSVSAEAVTAETVPGFPTIEVAFSALLPSGPTGSQHIGTGTNFPEHAEEANSQSVFQFPKFGSATPTRTQVQAKEGILLDYEVELCMRFDRDIKSAEDFELAVKGIFLCGDFTNRNALVTLADPDNLDSGYGFSDAKSGSDSFPTGPFLVIPKDWESFVTQVHMTTAVNDEPRQDARGKEMTLNFKQLTTKALKDMSKPRFLYQDKFHLLAENNMIAADSTLMSGTSEGVIFTPPTRGDIIEGAWLYISRGGPFSETTLLNAVREKFIGNELRSGHFLQSGDLVRHGSNYLGNIEINVVE